MRMFALAVAAALALAQPAVAQETGTLKKIKDSGAITLGHRDTSIPFSYYDDKQQVVGYAMDICLRIVDAVKADLKLPKIEVKLNPVTSATRIPLMANGTIDLKYLSTWMDSAGTTIYTRTGRFDSEDESLTLTGEVDDYIRGKSIPVRERMAVVSPTEFFFETWEPGPDGKDRKVMEVRCTRKP